MSDVRQPYRKSFDIFSVGCTLLEIGLWSPLVRILRHHSINDVGSQGLPEAADRAPKQTLDHSDELEEAGNKRDDADPANQSFDLMKLRHELLCIDFSDQGQLLTDKAGKRAAKVGMGDSEIMASLAAAMGERFTKIVKDFLSAGSAIGGIGALEHENALTLEMTARDTIRAIAEAV